MCVSLTLDNTMFTHLDVNNMDECERPQTSLQLKLSTLLAMSLFPFKSNVLEYGVKTMRTCHCHNIYGLQ